MGHSFLDQIPKKTSRAAMALQILVAAVMSMAGARTARAQIFTTLYDFCSLTSCADGQFPYTAGLVQGADGNFYGVTYQGGLPGSWGSIFTITPTGTLTTLYSFCQVQNGIDCGDGQGPVGLVAGADGDIYGVTDAGGQYSYMGGTAYPNAGVFFRIGPSGGFGVLSTFCDTGTGAPCPNGGTAPLAPPIQGSDLNFYGTASTGGNPYVGGGIYSFSVTGASFSWTNFPCSPTDCGLSEGGAYTMPVGENPHGPLVQGTDGNFYGTNQQGTESGATANGTIFKVTPGGGATNLYTFQNSGDGASPLGGLVEGPDGNFYGVTAGIVYPLGPGSGAGTVFKITPSGTLTTLHVFCSGPSGCDDGANPISGLILATDGNLYGTTEGGGSSGKGVIYSITLSDGTFNVVYTLGTQASDGTYVLAPLVQGRDGAFYGTTDEGGSKNAGTVFKLVVFPVVGLSSNSLSFPNQAVNTSSESQKVILTNTTTGSLEFSNIAISGAGEGTFSETNTCMMPLTQGESCSISVTYSPTSTGSTSATLTVTDNNNGAAGSTQIVGLSGSAFVPVVNLPGPIVLPLPPTEPVPLPRLAPPPLPVAGLAASALNFPTQAVGLNSSAMSVKLSNSGRANLAISGITLSGDFAQTNNCGGELPAGGSCSISVTFKPLATGARAGSLTVTDNSNGVAGSVQKVTLSGTGIQPVVNPPAPSLPPAPGLPGPGWVRR